MKYPQSGKRIKWGVKPRKNYSQEPCPGCKPCGPKRPYEGDKWPEDDKDKNCFSDPIPIPNRR